MPSFTVPESKPDSYLHDPGTYTLRVLDTKRKTINGKEAFELKLRVIRPDGSDGFSFFEALFITQAAFWRIADFLRAIGEGATPGQTIDTDDLNSSDWIGKEFKADIGVQKGKDGVDRNHVKKFHAYDGF